MPLRHNYPFHPVNSTAPSFVMGATNVFASTTVALESTAIGRIWQGPSGRAVRFAEHNGVDYHVSLGSSDAVAASTDSILMLGGTVETFKPPANTTHVAIRSVSTSTGAAVNVTIGYGQ